MIGGKELAEIGDEEILDAIAIHIRHRDVRRVRNARDDRECAAG